MKKLMTGAALALAMFAFSPVQARDGVVQVAAGGSCKTMFNTCAARCKQRAPDDKNCVSDHCSPKLEECRSTGCWQEGKMYGGKETCGLAK